MLRCEAAGVVDGWHMLRACLRLVWSVCCFQQGIQGFSNRLCVTMCGQCLNRGCQQAAKTMLAVGRRTLGQAVQCAVQPGVVRYRQCGTVCSAPEAALEPLGSVGLNLHTLASGVLQRPQAPVFLYSMGSWAEGSFSDLL